MSDQDRSEQAGGNEEPREPSRSQQSDPRGGSGGGGRHGMRRRHRGEREGQTSRRIEPAINMDELREIVDLIAAQGFTEFELEREGFRVHLKRDLASQTQANVSSVSPTTTTTHTSAATTAAPTTPPPATSGAGSQANASGPVSQETAVTSDADLHQITSPIVGTFYRAPSPAAEPFVRVGSHVDQDTVVCIIEAMKLMNEIQAEAVGVVEKIYVENGQPVEYGQPLFGIKK